MTAVRAWVLRREALVNLGAEGAEILARMEQMLPVVLAETLYSLDDRYSTALQQRIQELEERQRFSYFFVAIVIMLLSNSVFALFMAYFFPDYDIYSRSFNWLFLIIAVLIPIMTFFSKIQLSLQDIGLTRKKWRPSLRDGILFSGLAWIVLALLLRQLSPGASPGILIDGLAELISWSYLLHSFLQEFIRATVQLTIQRYYVGRSTLFGITLTAIIFAILHGHFGLEAVVVTFFGSLLFGWLYSRTYNLIGVSLAHFFAGWMAFNLGLL